MVQQKEEDRENRGQKENADGRTGELAFEYKLKAHTHTKMSRSQKTVVCNLHWESSQKFLWVIVLRTLIEKDHRGGVGTMPKRSFSLASAHVLWRKIHLTLLATRTHIWQESKSVHTGTALKACQHDLLLSQFVCDHSCRTHCIKADQPPWLLFTDCVNQCLY